MKLNTLAFLAAILATTIAHPLEKRCPFESTDETEGTPDLHDSLPRTFSLFQPKVFILNMFKKEATAWLNALDFTHNISIPGLSPIYPTIFCTTNYSICEMTTGEGEINAAASVSALGLSPLFDLSRTYFLISGIAGGEPNYTTIGTVTYAKYAIQVALEYQVAYQDFIAAHPNWSSGYWAFGTEDPWTYPQEVYGTEVFELNARLRDRAVELAETAVLQNGSAGNEVDRLEYSVAAVRQLPSIVKCDVLTSDNYFAGNTLSNYFSFFASLITNGSATYCSTAQEDNASLEALTRLDRHGLVDFNRIVVQRSISDITRPPPAKSNDTVGWFSNPQSGGSAVAFANLPIAGLPFVRDILAHWNDVYWSGKQYAPINYSGDILGSLGGTPDFGKSSFLV